MTLFPGITPPFLLLHRNRSDHDGLEGQRGHPAVPESVRRCPAVSSQSRQQQQQRNVVQLPSEHQRIQFASGNAHECHLQKRSPGAHCKFAKIAIRLGIWSQVPSLSSSCTPSTCLRPAGLLPTRTKLRLRPTRPSVTSSPCSKRRTRKSITSGKPWNRTNKSYSR